jgi:TonB family protein
MMPPSVVAGRAARTAFVMFVAIQFVQCATTNHGRGMSSQCDAPANGISWGQETSGSDSGSDLNTSHGGLSKKQVAAVVDKWQNEVKRCYELALGRHPYLTGEVKTRFVIGANGEVVGASIICSSTRHPPLEWCIVDVMRQMKFPPPLHGGRVVVNYPWIFTRSGSH